MDMDSKKLDELDDVTCPDPTQDFSRSSEPNNEKKEDTHYVMLGYMVWNTYRKEKGTI